MKLKETHLPECIFTTNDFKSLRIIVWKRILHTYVSLTTAPNILHYW